MQLAIPFLARSFLGMLTAVVGAALTAVPSAAHAAGAAPNILIILADDLGYGDLTCYGAKDLKTPNIDRLVGEGMKFVNFRANCCVCSPTRAALMTGRYQELIGVPGVIRTHPNNSWGWLAPNAILLPQALKPAGYHSAIVGKWHLGLESPNLPNDRGFDLFHGFLGDMMDDYYTHLRHDINYLRHNREIVEPKGHATEVFTDWACDYLRERAGAGKPFFLYLAYNAPHSPTQPPEDWLQKVKAREPGINEQRAKLVALIEHLDAGVARVLATLKETGLEQNTLVIFSSDNGGQLEMGANNGPTRGGKQSMYEGGLRVPFAVRWPGRIKAGSQSERVALTMDVYPTVLDAAGVKISHHIEGLTFLPVLLGQDQAPYRRDLFFTRREGGNQYGGKTIDAVVRGDWKLLQNYPWQPLELYNLKSDPLEQNDLASKQRKVFNELSAALRAQIQRGGAVPWQPPEQ